MAPDRERSKSPIGRTPLPATVMNVKMCCAKCEEKAKEECEEVEGVVKVVAKQSENKVIVYGAADPSALLKKMRRHLDKHAMYWSMDETNQDQVAPPLIPVDPRELHLQNRGRGPPLDTGTVLPVDPRDGRPLVDSREVRQVEREFKDTEHRERTGAPHPVPREVNDIGQGSGPREVVFVPVDAKDGTPVDPRSVRKVQPAAPAPREEPLPQALDARDLLRPVERMELRGERTRDSNHGAPGPAQAREVIFIPVDAKDGTSIDPRRVHQVDARDGRPLDPRGHAAAHALPGHGQELREVRSVHESPRELLGERPPIELWEVRPVHPPGDGPVSVDGSELRPMDPRNMMRHGDRMDPHVPRTSEPPGLLGRRDDLRPVDPRVGMQTDPRNSRPALDARDMDPRDGRAAAAAYWPSDAPRGVRGLAPEGLSPVRTGRDSREEHFSPRRTSLSPTHAPRDMGPRSPRDADVYSNMAPSPRQHAPDYGPRSPRDDAGRPAYGPRSPRGYYSGGAEYGPPISPRSSTGPLDYGGPRSPRARAGDYDPAGHPRASAMRPALDRELSFTEFGPGYADVPAAAAMDRVGHTAGRGVPLPYEPLDPRDSSAAFDFHGGGGAPPHPRSPRSTQPPLVRGYGDIDPRQFRPPGAEPRVLLDVTHDLPSGNNTRAGIRYDDGRNYMDDPAVRDRDDPMSYRRSTRSLEGSLRRPQEQQHVSQYSEFRNGEADILRDYQPKESYFSDYHPSQNYQPGPLATQDIDDFPVTNPNYKKRLSVGPDQF